MTFARVPLYPGSMAIVQVIEQGRFVVFGWPKEDGAGAERLRAEVMRGAVRGHAQLALQALQVPALRTRLTRDVAFDVPLYYSQGSLKLRNSGANRRYLRITVAGRVPLWLRFDRPVRRDLVEALQAIGTKVTGPAASSELAAKAQSKPRRRASSGSTSKRRKKMSKAVKQPGGYEPKKGPQSKRGEVGKKIPGSKPPQKTEMSRGWDGKKG